MAEQNSTERNKLFCQQVFSEFHKNNNKLKFINMINNEFNLRFMSLLSHIHIILDFIGIEK